MRHFNEITGLRIYLALWVALGHAIQTAYPIASGMRRSPIQLLINGHAAVLVFIIISGFVITHMLLNKAEPYPRYITRRFFRLFPAYFVCCVAGLATLPLWIMIVDRVPWQGAPGWAQYAAGIHTLRDALYAQPVAHIAAHALLLHGAIPDQILPEAASTILPAAWSISLEWQFYLIAPFVLFGLRHPVLRVLIVLVAGAAWACYVKGLFGTFSASSFIAIASPYFAIGIASRLAYARLQHIAGSALFAAVAAVIASVILLKDPTAVAIWCAFYAYLLWGDRSAILGPWFRRLTASRLALLLGEASYSLYLVHRPVQIVLGALALSVSTMTQEKMLVVQIVATLIAIPISIAMYFLIERPGIELGRRVAAMLPSKSPPLAPEGQPLKI